MYPVTSLILIYIYQVKLVKASYSYFFNSVTTQNVILHNKTNWGKLAEVDVFLQKSFPISKSTYLNWYSRVLYYILINRLTASRFLFSSYAYISNCSRILGMTQVSGVVENLSYQDSSWLFNKAITSMIINYGLFGSIRWTFAQFVYMSCNLSIYQLCDR